MIFGFLVNMENTIAIYFYSTPWALSPQNDALPLNSLFWSPLTAVHGFDTWDISVPGQYISCIYLSRDIQFLVVYLPWKSQEMETGKPRNLFNMMELNFPRYQPNRVYSKLTVCLISSDPSCKDCNARFTTLPLKPFLISIGIILLFS